MKNLSLENMNREGKIKRTKCVIAIRKHNKYINMQLYIFNRHFRWALLKYQHSEMGSLNCIIIAINIHCYYRLQITFIYVFFSKNSQHYFIQTK